MSPGLLRCAGFRPSTVSTVNAKWSGKKKGETNSSWCEIPIKMISGAKIFVHGEKSK